MSSNPKLKTRLWPEHLLQELSAFVPRPLSPCHPVSLFFIQFCTVVGFPSPISILTTIAFHCWAPLLSLICPCSLPPWTMLAYTVRTPSSSPSPLTRDGPFAHWGLSELETAVTTTQLLCCLPKPTHSMWRQGALKARHKSLTWIK